MTSHDLSNWTILSLILSVSALIIGLVLAVSRSMPGAFMKHQITISTVTILPTLFLITLMLTLAVSHSDALDAVKEVSVMYAGSLVKIFENDISPSFHNQTGYIRI